MERVMLEITKRQKLFNMGKRTDKRYITERIKSQNWKC